MDDGPAGHAMTEVALALAMSFFCLLVLTLVSMGVPEAGDTKRIDSLGMASDGPAAEPLAPNDRLVVFHRDAFLDAEGRPVDPGALDGTGRVVLAVEPTLPMAEALAARGRIAAADLIVTPLDSAWLAALAGGNAR